MGVRAFGTEKIFLVVKSNQTKIGFFFYNHLTIATTHNWKNLSKYLFISTKWGSTALILIFQNFDKQDEVNKVQRLYE